MIIGSTKKLSKDVKVRYNAAVIKGDLEQVKSYTSQLALDPKDRDNSAIDGIEWSLHEWCNQNNLQVANYFLSLPQTRKWFGERSRPIELTSGLSFDFYANEKVEREQKFHEICKKIWKKLIKLRLTDSPLAADIINHLLQISQDCHFSVPAEFLSYKRMSLSSVWNAFTAMPARVSSFLFGSSESASADAHDINTPKSPAINDSDDSDSDYKPESDSDDDSDEDYQPDFDGNDTSDSSYDSEFDSETESDTDINHFDLIAYRKWQESEDMKQNAKRAQPDKPSSSDNVDSDVALPKRQRRN